MISKKFVCLIPSEKSRRRLQKLADRLGLDTNTKYNGTVSDDPFEFHMTLLYSSDEGDYPSFAMPTFHPITVNGACLMKLGDKASAIRTTYSRKLKHLRDHVIRELKLTHQYDDFIPHVSLSYNPDHQVELPKPLWYFPITFDRIEIKNADD